MCPKSMNVERWQQVKRILENALEREGAARAAYLTEACACDSELQREVETLVAEAEREDFLEDPRVARAPALPDQEFTAPRDGWHGHVDAVRLIDLAPYTKLRVITQKTRYEILVVAPLERELVVQGGGRFPEPTCARLYRQDAISVGWELRLEVGSRQVVTSLVESIEIVA